MLRSFRSRSTVLASLYLLAFAVVLFVVPYAVPVVPSISLSYVAGYSNKAAVLLLLAGAFGFAHLFWRAAPRADAGDSGVGARALLLAEAVVVGLCLLRSRWPLGSEAQYLLHRQNLLASGQHLYTGFDFLYGPALLMPGLWLARLLHVSGVQAYLWSWGLQWVAGVWMLWFGVRTLTLRVPFRVSLFAVLLAVELSEMLAEGANYTPFRRYAAVALACAVYRVWQRWGRPWPTVLCGVAAVALGLCVSPEQAFGLAFGLLAWFVLLAWPARVLGGGAVAAYAAGCAGCFVLSAKTGMFHEFAAAASGGFSMPLLASVENCVVLGLYVLAVLQLYTLVRQAEYEHSAVPLALCGLAMLPAAMGRCDAGHLFLATPAVLVGAGTMLAMPRVRRWYGPLFALYLIQVGAVYPAGRAVLRALRHQPAPAAPVELGANVLPCDRRYYVPALLLDPAVPYDARCVDLGYKRGLSDIYTTAQIDERIAELRARPQEPVLLEDHPFAQIFAAHEADLTVLKALEGKLLLYLPHARHTPISNAAIGDYIQSHYTAGRLVAGGRLRVWEPRGAGRP